MRLGIFMGKSWESESILLDKHTYTKDLALARVVFGGRPVLLK